MTNPKEKPPSLNQETENIIKIPEKILIKLAKIKKQQDDCVIVGKWGDRDSKKYYVTNVKIVGGKPYEYIFKISEETCTLERGCEKVEHCYFEYTNDEGRVIKEKVDLQKLESLLDNILASEDY